MDEETIKSIAELQMAIVAISGLTETIMATANSLHTLLILNKLNMASLQAVSLRLGAIATREAGDEKTAKEMEALSEKIRAETETISKELNEKLQIIKPMAKDDIEAELKKRNLLN